MRTKFKTWRSPTKVDWLDPAISTYGSEFVSDVRSVLNVAGLFLLYPPFWALFDQQGSKWTFQVID